MYKFLKKSVTSPIGFSAYGVHAGIRKNKNKLDLGVIYSVVPCNCSAVYTQNKVFGAPLAVTREHIANCKIQAVICNSGNANTCNPDGVKVAKQMCSLLSKELNIDEKTIAIASTGVIGQRLDINPIKKGILNAKEKLSVDGGNNFSKAIMTTDTHEKEISISFKIGQKVVTIGACAKGSGMINPNMATLLAFITTDCNISNSLLNFAFKKAITKTLNMISIDGDSSTNDMGIILSNGMADNKLIDSKNSDFDIFYTALEYILEDLTKKIAKDGEGATKLIECEVINCSSQIIANAIAKTVISSNLVKAAFFASDANWGRILCAIGYSHCDLDASNIDVILRSSVGEIQVCKHSSGVDYSESKATKILNTDVVTIHIDMNNGLYNSKAWGCDLTYEYVKINAEYRT